MSTGFKRDPRVAWQLIDGEAVLVDLVTGETLGFNETGAWIWSHIEEQSLQQIGTSIASQFEITPAEAQRDVEEFVSELSARNLIATKDSQ